MGRKEILVLVDVEEAQQMDKLDSSTAHLSQSNSLFD